MNWTRSLVASAVLATCALVGAAAVAAPAPHPASASVESGPGDYKVDKAAVGKGVKVTITVTSQYHINKSYPLKWNKVPVAADKIAYSGGTADMPLTVTVTIPDSNTGALKFGYCSSDGSNCNFGEIAVAP